MTVKLLTKQHLECLGLKGGCTGSSESTLVKMPHCWKSHVAAQIPNEMSILLHIILTRPKVLRPEFFNKLIYGKNISDLGSEGTKIKNKKSSENDQLTGHFQSFFFFLISPEETVKLVR